MKKSLLMILTGLLIFMVLTACGAKKYSFDVDMKEYSFTPSTLEVTAGAEVTINLENTGTLDHDMVIMVAGKEATAPFDTDDQANVFWQHKLAMGTSESVTFTAPTEPGEYQIVCGIPAHLEQGMVGKLIVK